MSAQIKETSDQLIFRGTNKQKGRHTSITPSNSAMKHLVYGRVMLDQEVSSVKFSTGALESGLICLSGECTVNADGQSNTLGQYDSIYLPRDTSVEITTGSSVDLVECSAEVENKYPLQVVKYADVEKDGSLRFKTGGPSTTRTALPRPSRDTGPVGRLMNTLRFSRSYTFTTTCRRRPSACNSFTRIRRNRSSSALCAMAMR